MFSFHEFLLLEEIVPLGVGDDHGTAYHYHEGNVDGHHVRITYFPRRKTGAWVDFTVNGQDSHTHSGVFESKSGVKILHWVKGHVKDYVKNKKPTSLSFVANSGRKEKIYRDFTHQLARMHNGRVENGPLESVVHFD